PDLVVGLREVRADPALVLPGELEGGPDAELREVGGRLGPDAPDLLDRQLLEVAVDGVAGDGREPRGVLPFGADLRDHLVGAQARREGEAELFIEVVLDVREDLRVALAMGPPEAREVREALVDAVLLDVRGVAPDDFIEPSGEQAI